jgi:hypothetical protein
MKNHVKLEIAIQIVAEKIASLYALRNKARSQAKINAINQQLVEAYELKERVAFGDLRLIDEILNVEDGNK